MWKATAAATHNRGRKPKKPKTFQYREYADLDPYDDVSFDADSVSSVHLHGQMGLSHKLDETLPVSIDSVYVYSNPAMWTANSGGSFSMNKSEGAVSFEDMGKGKRKSFSSKKNIIQDSFASVGAEEMPHFRAARNRVDNLHPDEATLLFDNMHDDFDDKTIQTIESKAESVASSVKDVRLAPDPNSAAMLIAETLATRPKLVKTNSELSGKYDVKPEEIESMKRAPPQIAASQRRASSAPAVATVTEDDEDEGLGEDKPVAPSAVHTVPEDTEEADLAPATPDSSLAGMKFLPEGEVQIPIVNSNEVHDDSSTERKRNTPQVRFEEDVVSDLESLPQSLAPKEAVQSPVEMTQQAKEPENQQSNVDKVDKDIVVQNEELSAEHPFADDDDVSAMTLDDAGRLLEIQAQTMRIQTVDELAPLPDVAIANVNDDAAAPDTARSDITDSDNEGEGTKQHMHVKIVDAPVVVIFQNPSLSAEAKEFRNEAITAERSNQVKRSTGPSSSAYQLDGQVGNFETDPSIEMMAVNVTDNAVVLTKIEKANEQHEEPAEGVAVLEGGKWVVLSSAVPTPTPKFRGKFKKEKHAEAKGITTSISVDPLGFVPMSTFEPMSMPKDPGVVSDERISNATRVHRTASPDADPVCRDRLNRKSPTPLERAALAAA